MKNESSDVEQKVRQFYDDFGWKTKDGRSGEDELFRGFFDSYGKYHESVNKRTEACFEGHKDSILIGGGGDMPETHVNIAQQYDHIVCLDISERALEIARDKLKDKGEFIQGSLLAIPQPEHNFDAAYCPHVIYHIDKGLQENAVRELIRVLKPGGVGVILYRNPRSVATLFLKIGSRFAGWIRRLTRRTASASAKPDRAPGLYYFSHPLQWWDHFVDQCQVEIIAWDALTVEQEKLILRNNWLAKYGYGLLSWFERRYPNVAARHWSYVIVKLLKKETA